MCFQETGVDTHLESYMVAEPFPKPEIYGEMLSNSVNEYDVDFFDESKWRRPQSSRRSRRETKPSTQEKINKETEHIKMPQNQYTDKVVDVTVVIQEQVSQIQTMHRELEKETQQVDLGWTSETESVHDEAL